MTQKPRKRETPAETTEAIGAEPTATPIPIPVPATRPGPPDRLAILDDYAGPDGLLPMLEQRVTRRRCAARHTTSSSRRARTS